MEDEQDARPGARLGLWKLLGGVVLTAFSLYVIVGALETMDDVPGFQAMSVSLGAFGILCGIVMVLRGFKDRREASRFGGGAE